MSRLRIAHLSDPHFGTILPGVREGLLATLHELRPGLILLSGDITQRARRREFEAAKQFARELEWAPFIAVPGNHDIPLFNLPARLLDPYGGYRRLFKDQLERDYVQGDVLVTGLASTSRWRHVQGALDLDRVARRLEQNPRTPKVHVVVCHHPLDCPKPQDEKNLLVDGEGAMRLFADHAVDLVIGGHIHDPNVTLSGARYPRVPRSIVIGVAGTCLSRRTRANAPNSFNLIDVDSSGASPTLAIARYDLPAPGERFRPVREWAFRRQDELRGWVAG